MKRVIIFNPDEATIKDIKEMERELKKTKNIILEKFDINDNIDRLIKLARQKKKDDDMTWIKALENAYEHLIEEEDVDAWIFIEDAYTHDYECSMEECITKSERIRSYPVYYNCVNNKIIICDSCINYINEIENLFEKYIYNKELHRE